MHETIIFVVSFSLQELLGSGRRLSLKLLNFIARCQVSLRKEGCPAKQ